MDHPDLHRSLILQGDHDGWEVVVAETSTLNGLRSLAEAIRGFESTPELITDVGAYFKICVATEEALAAAGDCTSLTISSELLKEFTVRKLLDSGPFPVLPMTVENTFSCLRNPQVIRRHCDYFWNLPPDQLIQNTPCWASLTYRIWVHKELSKELLDYAKAINAYMVRGIKKA